jgi:chemotaxis protein methyltransferase CheR
MSLRNKKEHSSVSYEDLSQQVSRIVEKISGNILGEKQAHMVQSRIKKRMLDLNISNPAEYLDYINIHKVEETENLISLLTTHHTFFFREFIHFEFLKNNIDKIIENVQARNEKRIKIWSAACSKGQEVYSLAIFLQDILKDKNIGFEILGTDIDPQSVKHAKNGVYLKTEINEIPLHYIANNFSKGTKEIAHFVKVKENTRAFCEFKTANLLDYSSVVNDKFDIIFCRNVFIYFREDQISKIVNSFKNNLYTDGLLVTGISESMSNIDKNLKSLGPSVWDLNPSKKTISNIVKPEKAPAISESKTTEFKKLEKLPLIKVFCIDDSNSIIKLLSKILVPEKGFEVIGHAENGKIAHEKLKSLKPDIITLDIHMPEMDGIEYLSRHFGLNHPPVVMISSASREDSQVSFKALELGASDFVEKPSLNNIALKGEEIRNKLRVAFENSNSKNIFTFDREYKKSFAICSPLNKVKIIFGQFSDLKKINHLLKEIDQENSKVPVFVVFENQEHLTESFFDKLYNPKNYKKSLWSNSNSKLDLETVYIANFEQHFSNIKTQFKQYQTSIMILNRLASHHMDVIFTWDDANIVAEDVGARQHEKYRFNDLVPFTSFMYLSTKYLGGHDDS